MDLLTFILVLLSVLFLHIYSMFYPMNSQIDVAGNTLTNDHVLQYSLKAAHLFRSLGIKKGDVITISVENTLEYCIPELAAIYIGVVVNLLNPVYSVGEVKHALSITKPKLIICSKLSLKTILQAQQKLPSNNTKVLLLENKNENYANVESFQSLLEGVPHVDADSFVPETVNSTEDALFILMSSGTTGLPKGVLLTHENIRAALNYLHHEDYFGVTDKDTTIYILPFFHVFGILVQILSVAFGMKMVIMNKFKPDVFLDCVQKHKPTKLFIVPPLLLFLAKSPMVSNYDTSSIRDIMVGGAPTGKELQFQVMQSMKGVTIRLAYGLTETTAACAVQTFSQTVLGSIGLLVPHISMKVWDVALKQSVGVNQIGELCFKGPMIMKGYYGNINVTKECIDKDGFFHSGDVGYYDEDKNVYIVDRVKDLIKYKGYQVSPVEIEALILTHPAVKDCGVIGILDERAGEVPLAYVVKQPGVELTEQDVIDYVAERISVQKHLYGGVKFIEEIPKTPSGKILRRKLLEYYTTFLYSTK